MSQLKIRKRMGKTPIKCPCCRQETTVDETPLLSIFQKQLQSDISYKKAETPEAINEQLRSSIAYYARAADKAEAYQVSNWGCNKCVQDGKAIIADFTKQQPSYGGPYIMYIDLTLNCKYCTSPFCFSAKEQKHWYETLNLTIDAKATRCRSCRDKKLVQQRLMVLLAKQSEFTKQELEVLIGCYEIIGSTEKVKEFRGRLKNR